MGFWRDRRDRKAAKALLAAVLKLRRRHARSLAAADAAALDAAVEALRVALGGRDAGAVRRRAEALREEFDRRLGFARKSVAREYAEAFLFAIIIALLLRTFVIQLFKIPTGSMEPTLLGAQNHGFGDHIVVNKFIYGPQTLDWIGIPWTDWGFEIPTWRFERIALRRPERGDIVVFRFPYAYSCRDCQHDFNIGPDGERRCPVCGSRRVEYQHKDFVKRCIGLPGETVEIRDGRIYIDDEPVDHPVISRIHYWNIPPSKGPYGHRGQRFTVPEDAYFTLGDNSANSKDSRFWGFVPFDCFRGNAFFIYLPPRRIGLIR
ncbi:MAG: signal peptidase I [bacterium]|nr:signal peptidase I [bacterium]